MPGPLDKAQSRHMVRETTSSGTTDTAYAVNVNSHRYDSVGGVPLMYYRNRYYSPPLGRFVTGDPIGLWGDAHSVGNPYAYGGNSPAFLDDALGLQINPGRAAAAAEYAGRHRDSSNTYRLDVFTRDPTPDSNGSTSGISPGHSWIRVRDADGNVILTAGLYSKADEDGKMLGSGGKDGALPVVNPLTEGLISMRDGANVPPIRRCTGYVGAVESNFVAIQYSHHKTGGAPFASVCCR